MSIYVQSDIRTFRTTWFGALKDVWKVKTPTIFLVGQHDQRVPEPQSIEMYRALKSNGVPTHLYVAPRNPTAGASCGTYCLK